MPLSSADFLARIVSTTARIYWAIPMVTDTSMVCK
jgi:hypothetical protein